MVITQHLSSRAASSQDVPLGKKKKKKRKEKVSARCADESHLKRFRDLLFWAGNGGGSL